MSATTLGPRRWLISERSDFWFASAGASGGLLAAIALIAFRGDHELDWLDLVLSELHLGATYDAVIRRRLWRQMPTDILAIPAVILVLTFVFAGAGYSLLITSISMYAAIWHRGRQSFGVARYYQRMSNGPVSTAHRWLFTGAIYTPMLSAAFLYSHLATNDFDGAPYFAFNAGAAAAWGLGLLSFVWVSAYVIWTINHQELHPGEMWIVLANAVAFGSAYVLGAAQASFLFVLTVHHEVQYLYFTFAMARRPRPAADLRFAASFAIWPVIGLSTTALAGFYQSGWIAPLGVGGLFCHYWLDGRIWTRRAMAGLKTAT